MGSGLQGVPDRHRCLADLQCHLYKTGRDEASDLAYETVATGCSNMTHDYMPGHTPPG